MIANPTKREFAGMVREQLLTNCPVIMQDIDNANRIFGPDLANLRGEMTRTKLECIRVEYVQIPQDFVQLHKYDISGGRNVREWLAILGHLLARLKFSNN
jgi:hypothetical protein